MSEGRERIISWRWIFSTLVVAILILISIYTYKDCQKKLRESVDMTPYKEAIDSLDNQISGLKDRIEEEQYRTDSVRNLLKKSEISLDSVKKVYIKSREEVQNYKVEESLEFLKEYLELEEL